ncbi:cation transporting ATPase C-terminal domain-containing protein [Candidatus Woesearchaeota archaeon]|nr:cation transporting ATPase C-terminal domain-containing protein [Candidatus Woesearchaeota archaeon]
MTFLLKKPSRFLQLQKLGFPNPKLLFGIIMGAGTLFIFNIYYDSSMPETLKLAQTAAFTTLVMFEMFAVIGSLSISPFKKLNPLTNKWLLGGVALSILMQLTIVYWQPLQPVFGTVALGIAEWAKILAVSSLGFLLMELGKLFLRQSRMANAEV